VHLAHGLAAFLNSTVVDEYFRQFNGHTQVNATDLRNFSYPDKHTLIAIGEEIASKQLSQGELDDLVTRHIWGREELPHVGSSGSARLFEGHVEGTDRHTSRKVEYSKLSPRNKMNKRTVKTSDRVRQKVVEAVDILAGLGMPAAQQNDRSALTFLVLLGLRSEDSWSEATAPLLGVTEIMDYIRDNYGVYYAPNTRYQMEPATLKLVQSFGTDVWKRHLQSYKRARKRLHALQSKEREMPLVPVTLPSGAHIALSVGGQNLLIKQVIEQFCPRFTPGGKVLYVGDAGDKWKLYEAGEFKKLGLAFDKHGKMPDVVVFYEAKHWLILVEAVTSHGPIDIKRHNELKDLFKHSRAGLVFVTVFETRKVMMQYLSQISWETDVWLAESPTHLIHFNGERFLGPYPIES
jgi:adenine-specific DNA-methyltransferase